MPKKTRVAPVTCPNYPTNKKTIDSIEFSHSCIYDLGSLFKAIRDTSDKYSTAYELAGIGQYLANDWSNSLDHEREALTYLDESKKGNY